MALLSFEDEIKYRKLWSALNRKSVLLSAAKQRADIKKVPFTINEKDIHIPTHCPYLGCKLTYSGGRRSSSISLDRIVPSKGYVKGNIQVISLLANRMKSNATPEQLVTFAQAILKMHKLEIRP